MKINFWVRKNILLTVILTILVVHWTILIILVQKHSQSITLENKPQYIVIRSLEDIRKNTTLNDFQAYIHDLNKADIRVKNSRVSLTLSQTPANPFQFKGENKLKKLQQFLMQDRTVLRISYQLSPDEWLNYNTSISHNFYYYSLMLVFSELLIIAAILFYSWAIWRFSIPIKKLQVSAEKLGIDINRKPINISGPAIVQETANAVNQMQERIQSLIANKSKMLIAISHDLRTPLTRLRLRTQFINDKVQSEKITKDLEEMELMLNNILQFAKNDQASEKKVKFDISGLLTSICHDFTDTGHSVNFINEKNERILIFGRSMSFRRVFTNLIENGIKYGESVTVRLLENSNGFIEIIIKDKGPGIEESELDKVFEPYYRSASTRKKSIPGSGLGLAIAQEVIKAHGGTITLENCKKNKGLKVTVSLPVGF